MIFSRWIFWWMHPSRDMIEHDLSEREVNQSEVALEKSQGVSFTKGWWNKKFSVLVFIFHDLRRYLAWLPQELENH
jgi:hypothetical protein